MDALRVNEKLELKKEVGIHLTKKIPCFAASPFPSPSPEASEDEDADDGASDDDDEDEDTISSSDEEMTTSQ